MARSPTSAGSSGEEIPGVASRRAALRLLDAVLRRGDPLDQAAPPTLRARERADDRALATAIAKGAFAGGAGPRS